ncbi:hypothetical protein MMC10_001057 [Thelotrema lepadinum]|nr:hypothetical protein [Thelotrema lepadinum]
MGGKAFAGGSEPLWTPRLSPQEYFSTRNWYLNLLKILYQYVETPIEAPGKEDFGDIDVLVAGPKDAVLSRRPSPPLPTNGTNGQLLAQPITLTSHLPALRLLLHPDRIITVPGAVTTSFAVTHPSIPKAFVQLDLHLCPSYNEWQWVLFLHAHGDLWNLLGTSLRPYGLTLTDKGLFVRDQVVDAIDHKRSRVFLTDKPAEVLELLGYTESEFWGAQEDRRFESLEEMYVFATRNRFFRKRWYVRSTLKSNDRQRMVKREAFKRFVDKYVLLLPDDVDVGSEEELTAERQKVMEEVLEKFGKRGEWSALREAWSKERLELSLKWYAKRMKQAATEEDRVYADAWVKELWSAEKSA